MEYTVFLILLWKLTFSNCIWKSNSEESSECERGWQLFNENCYLDSVTAKLPKFAREKNYLDSVMECLYRGSLLLSLNSEDDERYLTSILETYKRNRNKVSNIETYWLNIGESKDQDFNPESPDNCSALSADLESSKYLKTSKEDCLKKYKFICKKTLSLLSNNTGDNCISCNNRTKRSLRRNLKPDIKPPTWNSPFRSSFNSPFWDNLRSDSFPRHPYQHPLNVITFHNVRNRLKNEYPKRNLHPILPIFRPKFNTTLSKDVYFSNPVEVNNLGQPVLRNMLPIRVLEIMKDEDENEKKYVQVKGCLENDLHMNGTCFRFQNESFLHEAEHHCSNTNNGTLTSDARVILLFANKIADNQHLWAGNGECKSISRNDRSQVLRSCSEKLLSICRYKEIEKEMEFDPTSVPNGTGFCPEDWLTKGEECFDIVALKKPWDEASSFCASRNAKILNNNNKWDKESLDFIFESPKFPTNEPLLIWTGKNASSGHCSAAKILILKNGQRIAHLANELCSQNLFFICELLKEPKVEGTVNIHGKLMPIKESLRNQSTTDSKTTKKAPLEGICIQEHFGVWFRYGDYCYQFNSFLKKKPTTREESQHICEMNDAFLASIHSQEENNWIFSKINTFQDNFLWIGGRHDGTSKFVWEDGSDFNYVHWAEGEPNNLYDMEECVSIRTHDERGEWNDDHCFERAGFICKKMHSFQSTTSKTATTNTTSHSTIEVPKNITSVTGGRVNINSITTVSPISIKAANSNRTVTSSSSTNTTTSFTKTSTTSNLSTTTTSSKTLRKLLRPLPVTIHSNPSHATLLPASLPSAEKQKDTLGGCPASWYRIDNKCVKYFGNYSKNYFEARDFCFSLDRKGRSSLVSIHSEKQLGFLFTLMTSYKNIWIGLRYDYKLDEFAWEDETKVDFVHWGQEEPTSYAFAMHFRGCVQVMMTNDEVGFWKDDDCTTRDEAFVCQRPLERDFETVPRPFMEKCQVPYDDFDSFQGSCYKFIPTPVVFEDAENACNKRGAHLVTVRSRKEMSYLWSQFSLAENVSDFWIGLKYFISSYTKTMKWNSGWFLFYTNFYSSHLELRIRRSCVAMSTSTGKWKQQSCFIRKPFICEYSKKSLQLTSSAQEKRCPKEGGWIDFSGDYCYSAEFKTPLTWADAAHYCLRKKAQLVSITSEKEQQNIQYIVDGEGKSTWIGATRLRNSEFIWSDSSKFVFKKWFEGEPRAFLSSNCVQMMSIGGFWETGDCFKLKPFICKAPKSKFYDTYEAKSSYNTEKSEIIELNLQSTLNSHKEHQDENQRGKIGGVAIGGILLFVLVILGSGFLAGFFFMKKRQQVQGTTPTTFYGFDNVIYNADTITVAGHQIICAPEERECILEDDEDPEETKTPFTQSSVCSEKMLLPHQ